MATNDVEGAGTPDDPWILTTPPGKSEFEAYRDLEASGIIETRGRLGSFIVGTDASARAEAAVAARDYLGRIRALGLTEADALLVLREALGPTPS